MSNRSSLFYFASVVMVAGCAQLIGVSDYEIDPSLDGAAGEGAQGGEGGSSSGGKGGKGGAGGAGGGAGRSQGGDPSSHGGEINVPQGGEPPIDQGGQTSQGGQGGEPPIGQGGETSQGGQAGGGQGGAPAEPIDCDSAQCCEDENGQILELELLTGGNFETNRNLWNGYYVTNEEFEVLSKATADSIDAYSGSWYAWLGGIQSDTAVLDSHEFVIPEGAQWLGFSVQRWFAFDSPALTGDFTFLGLYEPGAVDATVLFGLWDNYEFDGDDWEELVYPDIPAAEMVGNTYLISTLGVTDGEFDNEDDQQASNFFYDDFSFKAYRCVAK